MADDWRRFRFFLKVFLGAALAASTAAALALLLVGCSRNTPPSPPSPPQLTLAPLRVEGGSFVPELKGPIFCCNDPRNDTAGGGDPLVEDEGLRDGWPMANKEALDRVEPACSGGRCNFVHVRPGPYSRQGLRGTKYEGKAGAEVLPHLRAFAVEANRRGYYVEVSVVDYWTHASHPDQGAFGHDCRVTQQAPTQDYLAWVDALVSSTWDLEVIYNLGNEAFRCKPSAAWEDGLVAQIRATEAARGSRRHLVGSEWWLPDVRTTYDYVAVGDVFYSTPAPGTKVTQSYSITTPVILVEDDGGWHPPYQWKAVGSKIVWRGMMSDAEFLAALRGDGDDLRYPCPVPDPVSRIALSLHNAPNTLTVDGTPKYACPSGHCDYGAEGSAEGWHQRGVCESERGWPYAWYVNGRRCDPWAKPDSSCWSTGNPLAVFVWPPTTQGSVTVCALDGAGPCSSALLTP